MLETRLKRLEQSSNSIDDANVLEIVVIYGMDSEIKAAKSSIYRFLKRFKKIVYLSPSYDVHTLQMTVIQVAYSYQDDQTRHSI